MFIQLILEYISLNYKVYTLFDLYKIKVHFLLNIVLEFKHVKNNFSLTKILFMNIQWLGL
jgi:hypothetical protein